ncbi:MAG: hypothetical protein JJU26_13065 [Oceanicaulis sp.]|nr:hypothetical protein [Oceanicaulis sp.]
MGWTVYYKDNSPRGIDAERAEIHRLCTWAGENSKSEVVDAKKVGTTWYVAHRITPKASDHHPLPYQPYIDGTYVVCTVILTSRQNGEWGYKAMGETSGPYQTACPASILDALSPLVADADTYAREWRESCRAARRTKTTAITPGKLPQGTRVTLAEPVTFTGGLKASEFTVQKRPGRKRERTLFLADAGFLCRLPSHLLQSAKIQIPA